jgi:hypothetical protein
MRECFHARWHPVVRQVLREFAALATVHCFRVKAAQLVNDSLLPRGESRDGIKPIFQCAAIFERDGHTLLIESPALFERLDVRERNLDDAVIAIFKEKNPILVLIRNKRRAVSAAKK